VHVSPVPPDAVAPPSVLKPSAIDVEPVFEWKPVKMEHEIFA
jgi:hypothetical protein